jgi:gamma-glutamyltranspeptidase/glutathione hydrolase
MAKMQVRAVFLLAMGLALPAQASPQAVAAAHPLAAAAGLEILQAGGNAMDAAVAVQMVLSVVEPHASGLGGGAVMLHWDGRALTHFEGLSIAPARVTARLVEDVDGSTLPVARVARSGRAVAVPGAVAMLAMAHARHGRLPWAALFAPAIRVAEEGFAMPPYLRQVLLARRAALAAVPGIRALFFDEAGQPLPVGTRLRNPEQAQSLRLLADQGPAALYRGALGAAVLAAVGGDGVPSTMTAEDLAGYAARERTPLCAAVFGRQVCSAAAPVSGGVAVLQQVMLAERLGIAALPPDSVEAAHVLLEASRLAMADRRRWVGDPHFVWVPEAGLLDPAYVAARAHLAAGVFAMDQVAPGEPAQRHGALPAADNAPLAEAATSHVAVMDGRGGVVSLTTTNNLNFGAEIWVGGFALNNAMTNFSVAPGQNAWRAGARPATTMAPTIVFGADGQPEIALGAGGGARIIDAVAVGLVELLAWDADPARATGRPRLGAQTGVVELERGTTAVGLAPGLAGLGHRPVLAEMNTGFNLLRRQGGQVTGAADPRRDGAVAAGDNPVP